MPTPETEVSPEIAPEFAAEFAPAKINLALHVTGRRANGYHMLDSLVVFCGIGDRLRAEKAPGLSLRLTGPFADQVPEGADNLVLRAARATAQTAAITLEKHLPPASGIGGGSADAAATIRLLRRMTGATGPDADTILALGADLPVCLAGRPARMRGIGERLDPVPPLPPAHLLLVNPRITLPTPAVFRALARRDNPPMPATLPDWPDAAALARWLTAQRNDLEAPALAIAPGIGAVLDRLSACPDALLVRMSGSGATCFALFGQPAPAQAAAQAIGAEHRDWWVAAGPVLR
ncbi:4-(cytidine 5'-diphospho)-2-C-methyl-D-erythritol kinase [Szabonella alba]|uniref:4-diphosphocytidyl-2-C-methyl-D-erythritol kinase n=1 Tax=Szabonella alba TaxID=2804194 RepID=A0A8K0XYG2_9RHOB|nr:4-(cytidine 5'-diphospho)-2-C-methyl-D-erythritol kinase [Szabonella alba]MBL4916035.1 4-(cytidine 5'-diphospho)-2-C-methyl-D-erythritol kinase [Szabonella alba]